MMFFLNEDLLKQKKKESSSIYKVVLTVEEVASELDNSQTVFSATRERLFAVGF